MSSLFIPSETEMDFARIDVQELAAQTPSISFVNLGLYRDLNLRYWVRTTHGAVLEFLLMQFNADVGPNYEYLYGHRKKLNSHQATTHQTQVGFHIGSVASAATPVGEYTLGIIRIPNYRSAVHKKTFHSDGGDFYNHVGDTAIRTIKGFGIWECTDPLTRIDISSLNGAQLCAGSVFTLYGLR